MPELNGGVWATTGILAVYALELVLGSPSRAYYLVTSLAIVATVLVSWRLYHSLLLSALIGLCFALTTYDYVSYALSGGMIFPLVITFAVFYFYCQYELFRESDRSWLWWPLFAVSLLFYALSYEGWLDSFVLQWIVYPILAYLFYRRGDRPRMQRAIGILLAVSVVAAAYIVVKLGMSYKTLHSAGLEADTVFNYRRSYWLIALEDVIVNIITLFYTGLITYLPPQLFNFSMSSWYFGNDVIVGLQKGYHATHTHLVAYSHLFLWRFYAGIAFALFSLLYLKALRRLIHNLTPATLSFFVFMTMVLVGSPTHALVKTRPMHTTPLLGYQVHVSIIGVTFLVCYSLYYLFMNARTRWPVYLLLSLFCINLGYCAVAKPSLLSHMSNLSGLGTYPLPFGRGR